MMNMMATYIGGYFLCWITSFSEKNETTERGFFVTIYRLEDSIDNRCVGKKDIFSVGDFKIC